MESDTPSRDTAWATSEENVEIVRKLHAAINAADAEAVLALLDPEIVWVRNPNAPAPRTFHGHDGMREFQRMVAEVAEVPHPAACPSDLHAATDSSRSHVPQGNDPVAPVDEPVALQLNVPSK
jgi:ketosteroid isomerase-like protein